MKTQEKQETSLSIYLEKNGLEPETKKTLLESFEGFFKQTEEWKQKAEGLVITDVSQVKEMKEAEIARKALKEIRVNTEHTRKALKEESLRKGQSIDAIATLIKNEIIPIETHLKEQEDFIKIQEEKRKQAIKDQRLEQLEPYEISTEFYDLANMPDEVFSDLLANTKAAHEAKLEKARQEEEARIAAEKAEAEERERQRLENIKLKKEAEEREKQLAEERAKAEAERKAFEEKARKEREAEEAKARKIKAEQESILKKEREEREKAQAELKAKHEAEEAAKKAEAERVKNASLAPDKEKLEALAKQIEAIKLPTLSHKEAGEITKGVETLLGKVTTYIRSKSKEL